MRGLRVEQRANLMAASMLSVPELQKKTRLGLAPESVEAGV